MNAPIIQLPRVTLSQSADRPQLDFVLPGLLAGSVGMIVGQGAVGKSMLALQLGLAVAAGRQVAGGLWSAPVPGPVTVIAGEDGQEILQERLYWLRAAADIDDVLAAAIDEQLSVLSADGFDLRIITKTRDGFSVGPFFAALRAVCVGQRLVVVDPLAFLHDADENDNGAATHLIRVLKAIARETGSTIIILHHVGKGAGDGREAWAAARGASALTTAVRWQLNLAPPTLAECTEYGISDDMRASWASVLIAKSNYGAPAPKAFLRRGQGGILEHQEIHKAPKRRGSRRDDSGELIRSAGTYSLDDFIDHADLPPRSEVQHA